MENLYKYITCIQMCCTEIRYSYVFEILLEAALYIFGLQGWIKKAIIIK